jgi:hypothetical protein
VFKTRAGKVQSALTSAGFNVIINSVKPRKGSFVITIVKDGNQKNILQLLDMQRPFNDLKSVNIDTLAEDIIQTYTTL